MALESRHLSEYIDLPADKVYAYVADPSNIPAWAPGLGTSVTEADGQWYVETPDGRVAVTFAPRNAFGVLDHDVTLPSGEVVANPLRVLPNEDGSEIVFTVRRTPGMSPADFDRDAGLVAADLARLKRLLEGGKA